MSGQNPAENQALHLILSSLVSIALASVLLQMLQDRDHFSHKKTEADRGM